MEGVGQPCENLQGASWQLGMLAVLLCSSAGEQAAVSSLLALPQG